MAVGAHGTQACLSGTWGACLGQTTPSAEACDGIDNDCDGALDDADQETCGIGACRRTAPACVAGEPQASVPGQPALEICDGIDNDCDGAVDDGLGQYTCGVGACQRSVSACVGGQLQECVPGPPSVEVCDNQDNDCHGAIDDGNPGGGLACTCKDGRSGTTYCGNGWLSCYCD